MQEEEDVRFSFQTTHSVHVGTVQSTNVQDSNGINMGVTVSNEDNPSKRNAVQIDSSMIDVSGQMNDGSKYEKYIDIEIDANEGDNGKEAMIPYLEVEEKGIKKDYIGTHIMYEISLIMRNKKEKTILSYRRYDNFYAFYKKLKAIYPYYIYPILSKKNIFAKIFTDEQFMQKRQKQLKYFLNYLYNHSKMKTIKEFSKFIKDPEFDEEFFKPDTQLPYPESQKYSSGSFYKVMSSMSSMITSKGSFKHDDSSGKTYEFYEARVFYKNLLDKLVDQMKSLLSYSNSIDNLSRNYTNLSSNMQNLKGRYNLIPNDNNQLSPEETVEKKNFFHQLSELTKDLSIININYSKEYENLLNDDFDNYILSINGVVEAFKRYEEFMVIYTNVHQAAKDSKVNNYYDTNILHREVSDVDNQKLNFEQILEEELKAFIKENNHKFSEVIGTFTMLCCSLNISENNKLNEYKSIIN